METLGHFHFLVQWCDISFRYSKDTPCIWQAATCQLCAILQWCKPCSCVKIEFANGYELPSVQEVTQYWLALNFLCADSPLLVSGCLPPPSPCLPDPPFFLDRSCDYKVSLLSCSSQPDLYLLDLNHTSAMTAAAELAVWFILGCVLYLLVCTKMCMIYYMHFS